MPFVSYHPLFCGILRLLPELKKTSFTLLQNKLWKTTDPHQTPQRQLVSKQALCRVILIKIFKEFSRDSWVICINDMDMAHMQAHPLDPNHNFIYLQISANFSMHAEDEHCVGLSDSFYLNEHISAHMSSWISALSNCHILCM